MPVEPKIYHITGVSIMEAEQEGLSARDAATAFLLMNADYEISKVGTRAAVGIADDNKTVILEGDKFSANEDGTFTLIEAVNGLGEDDKVFEFPDEEGEEKTDEKAG